MTDARRRYRPGVTNPEWGADADAWDHRDRKPARPKLSTTEPGVIGRIYGPGGRTVRVVREERAPFGFHPRRTE